MFRKISILALALFLAVAPALAAGKLTVNQEVMNAYDSYGSVQADVFAEVENTGDSPVEFSAGLLELLDAQGNTIDSTDYVYCYPSVLAPGEKGYVIVNMYPENAAAPTDIAQYKLNLTGKDTDTTIPRLTSTGVYENDVSDGYWTYDYLTAEITNDSQAIAYDYYVVYAVKDAEGNLIYATYYPTYSIGIPVGGSAYVRTFMPDGALAYQDANGKVAATVETIAYESTD